MRLLTNVEMTWIAGGYDSVDGVTVEPPKDPGDDDDYEPEWPDWPEDEWDDEPEPPVPPPPPPPPPDVVPKVKTDGTPGSEAAAQKLRVAIEKVDDKIDALPPDMLIRLPNGELITTAEFKALWEGMSFTVTAQNFGTDRAGANVDGAVSINTGMLEGYAAHGENGLTFFLLHELGHITDYGQAMDDYYWKQHQEHEKGLQYDGGSLYFVANEMAANTAARDIAAQTGITYGNFAPKWNYINP